MTIVNGTISSAALSLLAKTQATAMASEGQGLRYFSQHFGKLHSNHGNALSGTENILKIAMELKGIMRELHWGNELSDIGGFSLPDLFLEGSLKSPEDCMSRARLTGRLQLRLRTTKRGKI